LTDITANEKFVVLVIAGMGLKYEQKLSKSIPLLFMIVAGCLGSVGE
jgi:hypothetical protein